MLDLEVDFHNVLQALDTSLYKLLIFLLVYRTGFGRQEELDDGIFVVEVP